MNLADPDPTLPHRICNNHNKADGFERRIEVRDRFVYMGMGLTCLQLYLVENFRHSFELER